MYFKQLFGFFRKFGTSIPLPREEAKKIWIFLNGNFVSVITGSIAGAIVSHQFTKAYRDQEIKDLLEDVRIYKEDLKNRNKDLNDLSISSEKLRASGEMLRNDFIIQSENYGRCREQIYDCRSAFSNSYCIIRRPYLSDLQAPENTTQHILKK